MNQNISFFDFNKNITYITPYIQNTTLNDYELFLNDKNIYFDSFSFINNFKLLNSNTPINILDNIIIISKSLFKLKSIPIKLIQNNTNISNTNTSNNSEIKIDEITTSYLTLLQKYPDLISFIIILKTHIVEYITLYLKKYRKKNIYNIIRNNQQEIIDMIEKNNNFINFYIRTCNVNVLQSLLNYSYNSIIISQIEEIFPDVPTDNIEELIEIFYN